MIASVFLGMLCLHLVCFCVMFYLISTRLPGKTMGMEIFALGNLLLGMAYILQLVGQPSEWSALSVFNHTLTLCAPVAYVLGALRFFNRPTPLWPPLLVLALGYTLAQLLLQWTLGPVARYALLSGTCSLLFLMMTATAWYGARTFASDLRIEMYVFVVLIGGLCGLNIAKFIVLIQAGLPSLEMNTTLQTVFYSYMSFLGTVLPPCLVWLVLRRLTDELTTLATHDPLTQLLNRRGLLAALTRYFHGRHAAPAYLLLIDMDHFKQINDELGHHTGDTVLCHIARVLQSSCRQGDLICRLGGEEFVVVCLDTDAQGAQQLAERIRTAIEAQPALVNMRPGSHIACTATLGVSAPLYSAAELSTCIQQADHALYRGKHAGRNRVETARSPLPSSVSSALAS